uniref:Uncharacterized protein n=1 Tax=Cacopsylla melanoneura TaxID=428564 RepID=A0A8D8ZH76_9HEMI
METASNRVHCASMRASFSTVSQLLGTPYLIRICRLSSNFSAAWFFHTSSQGSCPITSWAEMQEQRRMCLSRVLLPIVCSRAGSAESVSAWTKNAMLIRRSPAMRNDMLTCIVQMSVLYRLYKQELHLAHTLYYLKDTLSQFN